MTCIIPGCPEVGVFRRHFSFNQEGLVCANHRNTAPDTELEAKVARLQRLLRLANGQLESSFAPLTAFQVVHGDPALRAELAEALHQRPAGDRPFCLECGQALPE